MQFDPLSRTLNTDQGELIKQLSCDVPPAKRQLRADSEPGTFRCNACARQVVGTAGLSDQQLVALLRANPATCLRVDLKQDNVRVVYGRR
jgi:hypothetical protein